MTKDKVRSTEEALNLALEALETNNKAWKHLADSGDAGFWEAEEQPFYELSVKAITAIKEALMSVPDGAQRSFDYKEHAEGLQRDYDLLLAEYNLLKQDLITVVDIEKIVKFKERNK